MHSLKPLTPLGGTTPRRDEYPGLILMENPDWAMASVAARAGSVKKLASAFTTFAQGKLAAVESIDNSGKITNFWTAPDQWMVMAPFASHESLAADLKAALGNTAAVVEQTDGWCRFDLSGAHAVNTLERLSAANSRRMQANRVCRTQIDHLGCFMLCHKAGQDFSILGPRSAAASLHHALTTAAISIA